MSTRAASRPWFKTIGPAMLGFVVLLAGCATTPKPVISEALIGSDAWFLEQVDWSLTARMAVSDGQEGGQLHLLWRSQANRNELRLRSGVAGPRWRLVYDDLGAMLSGSQIEDWSGSSPASVVFEATGWPIPIEPMRQWLRGLPSVDDEILVRDRFGQIKSLVHEGWAVEFKDYQAIPVGSGRAVILPGRLEFSKPPYRVRVMTERWDW